MRYTVNPRQGRLFDPFEAMIPPLGLDRIRKGWQGIFRATLLEVMPAQQLGKHFSPNIGRHTKELYSVAGLLFLQEFQNWTNPEAVHAYLFHTDVQFALNLEPGCDEMCERTFERYRALFLEDEGANQIMQDVTDRLIDLLELDIAKQRLDSTHVFSNMASFGRTRLMAVAIKRFLTQVKRHHLGVFEALPAELRQRYAPSQAQLLSKESKDADGRAKSRQQVAEDLRDLINHFADHAGLRERPSYQALVTVFAQQCEIVNDRVQERTKTGGACVQNPSDLDATYDGKKGQGYQAQFSETCSDANEVQLIVSVLPQTAVEADANALVPVLEDLQKRALLPEEMLADTSYGSDDNAEYAADLGVELVSPVSGPTPTTTTEADGEVVAKLTIDDFAVDERTGKVEACPAGRIPLQIVYDAATTTTTIHMSAEACATCPFRVQCPIELGKSTCKVSYTDKQKRLEGRRREQETAVFRQRYAKRSGLESTNSGIKRRLGLGQLRVRGRRAVAHALYLKVAGWNLLRASASGQLRGLVARALARLGPARVFWPVLAVWSLLYHRKRLAKAARCVNAVPADVAS
jgi:Transposase DDE domain